MTQTNWTRRRFMTTAASAAGLATMPRLSGATDELAGLATSSTC